MKNKIFLGDNGSLLILLLISLIVIKAYNESYINSCDEIFILMILPGIDMARLFIERISNKRNPFSADGNNFHHILLKKFKLNYVLLVNSILIITPLLALLAGINTLIIIFSFLFIYLFILIKLKKI
jgi:UDP-GlcNAc:undecaprenyl-phosphate GlcNAc-1-phosphate transferase|tara:strand:+ start:706 stop:1086 length:381 start_codon:yes stop_codon:yes gene_type:complete